MRCESDGFEGGYGFAGENRMRKRSEFRLVYEQGHKVAKSDFLAFCLRRGDEDATRVGFTTPRALGKATRRNRIRRRVREAVRLNLWRLPAGWSVVFNPRRSAATRPFSELSLEVQQVLERCAASSSSRSPRTSG